jgi:hypothetical protein
MSDAIDMIDSASLNTAGCSTDTFLRRSIEPYERGPFDQISETRQGGAFTFLTGAGGFLQEFLYGFTGLNFTENAVQLDPMLPPQMQGLRLTGIAWQGRRFDVTIAPFATTITLTAGAPLPVQVAGGPTQTINLGASLAVSTRRPDLTPGQDLARCRPVVASTELPGYPALAAVDGATSTAWHASTPTATLTVDLGSVFKLKEIIVHSEHKTNGYTLSLSIDGKAWLPIATLKTRNSANVTTHTNVSARYVRYTVTPGALASIRELVVRK